MRRILRGIVKCNAGSKPPWRTPDHPPYTEMVEVALRVLSEEGGSTESSISAYIQSAFTDLPWGHDRLLPYYLGKLVVSGEISSPSHDRYQLSLNHHHLLSSAHSLVSRRGRPLYRQNPSSYASFKPPPSAPSRRRARSAVSRSRGRRPAIFSEGTQLLHAEQGSVPLRPRRGRPPLPRGGPAGRAIRRSVPRARRSRGSRIGQVGVRGRKLPQSGGCESNALDTNTPDCFVLIHAQSSPETLQSLLPPGPNLSAPELRDHGDRPPFRNAGAHCSSERPAFGNDNNDAASEKCAPDDHEQPMHDEGGAGHPCVASPQPDIGEGQPFVASLLPEHDEPQFSAIGQALTLEQAKLSYCSSPVGKYSEGEARPSPVLEQAEPYHEQTSPGRLAVLSSQKTDDHGPEMRENDDQGPVLPENNDHGAEIPENDGPGPNMPENDARSPEMPEKDDHGPEMLENDGHGLEMLENDGHGPEMLEKDAHHPEMSNDNDPKMPDEHGPEKLEKDEHGPENFEKDEHIPEKPENDVYDPEMPDNDDNDPEIPENVDHGPEKLEEDHDKCSPGKRTAMMALDSEVLAPLPLPDGDEVGRSGASTKKKRSHGKRRRLKLWFEG